MDVYAESDLPFARAELFRRLARGQVGVLPTDTLYGLSGDATQASVVRRIQRIKRRRNAPSLIPPSIDWALEAVAPRSRARFRVMERRYRGAFTTLWPAADRPIQRTLGSRFIGLRLPDHWITAFTEELGVPLVTTSVNRTTRPPMRDLESLDPGIASEIDFLVYEGPLEGPPSTLVWCDAKKPRLVRRA